MVRRLFRAQRTIVGLAGASGFSPWRPISFQGPDLVYRPLHHLRAVKPRIVDPNRHAMGVAGRISDGVLRGLAGESPPNFRKPLIPFVFFKD